MDVQLAGIGAYSRKVQPRFGKYHVSEAFAELQLPLLAGLPAAEQPNLQTAWRTSRYTRLVLTIAGVQALIGCHWNT
ncbi:hypothetical protein [Alishewanella longhuensis]